MSTANELLQNPRMLEDAEILVVDSDRNSKNLYTTLFTGYGAKVTTIDSIEETLDLLDWLTPDILICEIGSLHEGISSLIQQVRYLALSNGRAISILVTSTDFTQDLPVKIKVYLLNPVDIDPLIYEVWNLIRWTKIAHPLNDQDRITRQNLGLTLCCCDAD